MSQDTPDLATNTAMADGEVDFKSAPQAVHYSEGYQRMAIALLALVYIFNFVDRQVMNILAQSIKTDLQLSDTQLGLITGLAFAIFYSVLGLPIARYAERGDRPGSSLLPSPYGAALRLPAALRTTSRSWRCAGWASAWAKRAACRRPIPSSPNSRRVPSGPRRLPFSRSACRSVRSSGSASAGSWAICTAGAGPSSSPAFRGF